jgi:hypothetical protein
LLSVFSKSSEVVGAVLVVSRGIFLKMVISTLRFLARPSSVSFVAMGSKWE